MNYRSKYVILDKLCAIPVVFSDLMQHNDVAIALGGTVLGAGFCYIKDGKYVCYGKSVSLNVVSREDEDSRILNKCLGVVGGE